MISDLYGVLVGCERRTHRQSRLFGTIRNTKLRILSRSSSYSLS